MSQGNGWYNGQYPQTSPQKTQDRYQAMTTNNVQSGHRLLAVYPPASATPTHHVSRHISNISLTAAPTFPQQSFLENQSFQANPYSEYDQRLNYLASNQAENDRGYWENARNDTVKMLNEEAQPSYRHREPTQWLGAMPQSNYQTNAFAQSVFQLTSPRSSYPTPPPGISPSSSSLAHALGTSPSHGQSQMPPSPQKAYQPQDSGTFYEDFLDRKVQQMNNHAPPYLPPPHVREQPPSYPSNMHHRFTAAPNSIATSSLGGALVDPSRSTSVSTSTRADNYPSRHVDHKDSLPVYARGSKPPVPSTSTFNSSPQPVLRESDHPFTPLSKKPKRQFVDDSPDPLALKSGGSTRSTMTPKKRKLSVEIHTPVKRLLSLKSLSSSSIGDMSTTPKTSQGVPLTPSSSSASLSMSVNSTPSKRPNLAYVELPSRSYLTPKSVRKLDSDDLGGYGSELDSPSKKWNINDSTRSSARRTGDRDERGPAEKLTSLIEDIFEAEDSLPPEVEPTDLHHEFFSPLSLDYSRPLLAPAIIRKLTKYIGYVARPTKRLRQTMGGVMGTPRSKDRMTDLDAQQLARLLKILDRSVKVGEDVDPFPHIPASSLPSTKTSPKKPSRKNAKSKKAERSSRSATPGRGENDIGAEDLDEGHSVSVPTDGDFDKVSTQLDVARDSILAADCCIALLGSDRLPKQLYSEELITSCLNAVKNQLTRILYPFVESFAETGNTTNTNPLLQAITKHTNSLSSGPRHQLGELYQALSAVIPRINDLIGAENVAMSDTIIISAVYIAIGPFFVIDADADLKAKRDNAVIKTLGKTAMRGLRLDALSLIRSIFAIHDTQRSWIIEEILTSLIKLSDTKQKSGQFRLRDGRSIRTVSALLLQLVQTSAHDVRIQARKIEQTRKNNIALKRQESFNESQSQQTQSEPFLDDTDREELRLYNTALESATKAAKTIILFLTQRSGKGKVTKNSNEAEYRAIFENLIDDLLVVLFWPEWPAASLILSIASKFMVSSLDDVKHNAQTENNAAKQTALDHLGVIAAKLRTTILKFQMTDNSPKKRLRTLEEIVSNVNLKHLNRFLEAQQDIASHLCKRSSEDQAYDSARELTAATLGQELSSALKQVQTWIEHPEMDEDKKDQNKLLAFGQRIKQALRDVWKDPSTDVFNIGTQEEALRIDVLAEEIGTIQNLRNSFNPILSVILMALDSPAIFVRTKALKALGVIVTSDPTILSAPNVRRGIESHLLDSSAAVRDAAVELIGKYIIDSPKVATDYYQKIADRIADTAVSVRRRVVKLLKAFYIVTEDNNCMIDIATRLVLRILDEDETVKDLASKAIEELWFPSIAQPSMKSRSHHSMGQPNDKTALMVKVSVVMGTAANFKDRQSPLEDILHKIVSGKEGPERVSMHTRYGEICEALIDGLVDASDLPGFTVTNCVRTIYLLASAYPSILTGSNASTLLPYLKNASSAEELVTSDYLLKIFRVAVPHMPKTAAKFGQELQGALQPMIIKPSGGGGIQIMQETVGCMCIVVQHLTHDFIRLINLMKSCNARLQQMLKRPSSQELGQNDVRALVMLIFIVSLLAENCDFDNLRKDQQSLTMDIDAISHGSITEHAYLTLLTLYEKYDNGNLRARVLQCLGFLFRAQPTLMTMDRSAYIMDQIFASPEEDSKGRLLKIMQDFLVAESEKHAALAKESKPKPGDVNMDELIGNTEGFADSGVSSAIVQRYLDHVLEAALSQNASIQSVAIDVLTFTVKQGLAHPLQSFPVIVALETSPVTAISNRASALHAILQGKHASLLNARYIVSARRAYEYQKKITTGPVLGYRMQPMPVALLHRWYCHVREKRAARQDFLKSLVKVFSESGSLESTQDEVSYSRYMAENFASFEYKTLEEVFTVIKYLTNLLSTTGMQVLEIVSPSHLLTQLRSKPQDTTVDSNDNNATDQDHPIELEKPVQNDVNKYDMPALMRTSVIISIVMLLKAHLKTLYSLSEEKCHKFVVGKKSTVGDKTAAKRNEHPISWHRIPFATNALLTTEDVNAQKATFLDIWNEDGLAAEPQDDEFL